MISSSQASRRVDRNHYGREGARMATSSHLSIESHRAWAWVHNGAPKYVREDSRGPVV